MSTQSLALQLVSNMPSNKCDTNIRGDTCKEGLGAHV